MSGRADGPTARDRVVTAVAASLPDLDRPALVAVDGVDGAGKTVFADELAAALATDGAVGEVVRASVDGFHHPRDHRHALGRSAETFWSRSYDYPALKRELLTPWRDGVGATYRRAVHDVVADRALDEPVAVVPDREGTPADPTHPDQARYVDGQRIYLDTCRPRERADVVVDNTDLAAPRLLERPRNRIGA